MNKIISVETFIVKIPLNRTFVTAVRSTNHIDSIIVRVTLDNGQIGFGSAPATTAITGDTILGMKFIIDELFSPKIVNTYLSEYKSVLGDAFKTVVFNSGSKMAVDLAFHDLLSKQNNQSVSQFLGAKTNILETDVSISCGTIEDTILNITKGINSGFNIIKVKVGADFTRDVELLKIINKEFNRDTKFRFDANQGWTEYQSFKFISEFDKYDINVELIEQPVKSYNVNAMKNITQFSNIPILADESVFSAIDAERLISEKACNMLNIKLAKTGGILEAQKIKALANKVNMPCMIGCMMESPLGILAATSFALAENITMADLDVLDWVSKYTYSDYIDFNSPNIVLRNDVKGFGYQ